MSQTTVAAQIMVPKRDDSRDVELRLGVITIAAGEIVDVAFERPSTAVDFGDEKSVAIPGLVDCHVHLPQFDIVGAHGMPLLRWLDEITFPAELRWRDKSFAAGMTRRVMDQFIAVGTTSFAAFATNHFDATDEAIRIARDRGMRGVIGQVLMDRHAPAGLLQDVIPQIDQTEALLDRYPPGSRMAAAVTPRFAISCTEALMNAAGQLADRHSAWVQTHLAETVAECQWVSDEFGGSDYVEVYRRSGLLGPRTILGHGIHLDEPQRRALAEHQSSIAHCPTANDFLGAGRMSRQALQADDVGVCLGSDIGAGFERSMVRVARSMVLTAASLGHPPLDCSRAWWQATHGNAAVLGIDDYGIAVGKPANLILVRPEEAHGVGDVAPLSSMMFGWDDRWIRQVFLDDRVHRVS